MHEEYEIEDDDPDVCHHGVGFDETCEDCEIEIAEDEAGWREQAKIVEQLLSR